MAPVVRADERIGDEGSGAAPRRSSETRVFGRRGRGGSRTASPLRWVGVSVGVVGAALGSLLLARALAGPGLVDSRKAERALVLALEAELAGDSGGARAALEALRDDAEAPEEAVGRGLLEGWLDREKARLPGLAEGADREAVLATWDSLEPFGPEIEQRVWAHFERQRPEIRRRLPPVRIRVDRASGLSRSEVRDLLEPALVNRGVPLGSGGLELAVDLDATGLEKRGRWVRVRARMDLVLGSTSSPPEVLLRMSRAREERRTEAASARRFAVRRLALDAARGVSWATRRRALSDGW